jgi:hypothetical protein
MGTDAHVMHKHLSSRRRPGPNFTNVQWLRNWAPAFAGVTVVALALLLTISTAHAQADPAPTQWSGTLQKAQETGAITIGYRESSIPF